jgi:hypothetical protein
MYILMRILGVIFLAISLHLWLCVLVPAWVAAFRWRWKRGPAAGRISHAAFGVMFTAVGGALAFGDWLVSREYLIGFAILWVAGLLMAIVGGRLDHHADHPTGTHESSVRHNGDSNGRAS